ncbi:MAG TPA: Spy/CpxP family protein refolding chaperone, partial [Blastocatellia bacterium]|nr:Spy/CpxP family protein refolding chaperone [Blastocatellia bacterium]
PVAVHTQTPTSCAGQEKRQIKALSSDEIQAYESGEGMGLAKAAELNQFPGLKHVLDLAAQLQLTEKQKADTQSVFDRMHAGATRLGSLIVEKERKLDLLFASNTIDSDKLRRAVAEIAEFQGKLRAIHLQAHLEMRRLLSPAQIKKYDELRGYGSGGEHKDHQHKQ